MCGRARLYVFENTPNGFNRIADFYVTVGKFGIGKNKKGDKRTPVGLYTVTSHTPDSELEELYGVGAYPLSYPNEWDVRNGRNGHGIWLHGVPRNTYARPPKASDGCVVLSNEDLKALGLYISIGQTPDIIAPSFNWVHADSLEKPGHQAQKPVSRSYARKCVPRSRGLELPPNPFWEPSCWQVVYSLSYRKTRSFASCQAGNPIRFYDCCQA